MLFINVQIVQPFFSTKPLLNKHTKTCFDVDPLIEIAKICPHCGKSFEKNKYLQAHLKSQHNANKIQTEPLQCTQCSKSFSSNFNLTRHVNSKHQIVEVIEKEKVGFMILDTPTFESRPNYNHKEKESVESGRATLAGVVHFNSLNI